MTTTSTSSIKRAVAGLAVGVLALGACGSDDGSPSDDGGASAEEFCAQLGALATSDGSDPVAVLQDLAAAAPDDIADDMSDFADLFAEMSALDADGSEQAQTELSENMDDYQELAGRLDTWSNENCPDVPQNLFTAN